MKRQNIFKNLLLIILMFGTLTSLRAQKSSFSIQLGGLLPLGEFAEAPAYIIPTQLGTHGTASFGASLGFKYNYIFSNYRGNPLGIGIFGAADLQWNYINKDARAIYDEASCTKPMYVNVPIVVGVSYTSPTFGEVVGIWGEVGIGADLFMKTTEGWKDATIKYDMGAQFCTEVGIGVKFIDLISIGVHYYWLGNHALKVKNSNIEYDENNTPKMKIHNIAFKLGFHF